MRDIFTMGARRVASLTSLRFFFQAEDGIRDKLVTGVQTCALPIFAAEDRSFYRHGGVDLRGSLRALWADIRNRSTVQGGSTITQQYVKNAYVGEERRSEERRVGKECRGGGARGRQ